MLKALALCLSGCFVFIGAWAILRPPHSWIVASTVLLLLSWVLYATPRNEADGWRESAQMWECAALLWKQIAKDAVASPPEAPDADTGD